MREGKINFIWFNLVYTDISQKPNQLFNVIFCDHSISMIKIKVTGATVHLAFLWTKSTTASPVRDRPFVQSSVHWFRQSFQAHNISPSSIKLLGTSPEKNENKTKKRSELDCYRGYFYTTKGIATAIDICTNPNMGWTSGLSAETYFRKQPLFRSRPTTTIRIERVN